MILIELFVIPILVVAAIIAPFVIIGAIIVAWNKRDWARGNCDVCFTPMTNGVCQYCGRRVFNT